MFVVALYLLIAAFGGGVVIYMINLLISGDYDHR